MSNDTKNNIFTKKYILCKHIKAQILSTYSREINKRDILISTILNTITYY